MLDSASFKRSPASKHSLAATDSRLEPPCGRLQPLTSHFTPTSMNSLYPFTHVNKQAFLSKALPQAHRPPTPPGIPLSRPRYGHGKNVAFPPASLACPLSFDHVGLSRASEASFGSFVRSKPYRTIARLSVYLNVALPDNAGRPGEGERRKTGGNLGLYRGTVRASRITRRIQDAPSYVGMRTASILSKHVMRGVR